MDESLIKYLAGILDADGCLCFIFADRKGYDDAFYVSLHLNLASSDTVDKNGFVETLPSLTGMGTYSRETKNAQCTRWTITKSSDLEKLLPRIIKHMNVKAKHWQWMLDTRRKYKGVILTKDECQHLQLESKKSRATNVGPIKPKNHPSWGWLAGYLDGDGHFSYKTKNNKGYRNFYVGATAHVNDSSVLYFLQKAFGGRIYPHNSAPHVKRWRRNLGPRERSFALRFLPKLVKHSRLKRYQIEQILSIAHPQRLSASTPTGDATV